MADVPTGYNQAVPELPEVETVARSVDERLRGERIVDVWFGSHPQPFKTPPEVLARGLIGRIFLAVHRSGKHIVCELGAAEATSKRKRLNPQANSVEVATEERRKWLSTKTRRTGGSTAINNAPTRTRHPALFGEARFACAVEGQSPTSEAQWVVHLGMTGRLLVADPTTPVPLHTHARLTFSNGRELRFVDPRRFGRLDYKDLHRGESFQTPGLDPLTITPQSFAALFRNRRLSIKAALLNQSLLAGVGNIYADESLFRARIRPRRMAGRLSRAELDRLRLALRKVLEQAIRLGGSSISDYVNAAGEPGFFQMQHRVYQRTGLPCRRCGTPIRREVIAGRGSHFCPHCQH